jgi:hypothetical protein
MNKTQVTAKASDQFRAVGIHRKDGCTRPKECKVIGDMTDICRRWESSLHSLGCQVINKANTTHEQSVYDTLCSVE